MTTLKEHQAAMVDLLANGSGIPASASRLAHAMHDVLVVLNTGSASHINLMRSAVEVFGHKDATAPGINEKDLSKPVEPIKTDSPAKWPLKAEQRIKQLNNTIQQLRDSNAKLREELADKTRLLGEAACSLAESKSDGAHWYERCLNAGLLDENWVDTPEQSGCRKPDTQVCEHRCIATYYGETLRCDNCGAEIPE